MIKTRDAIIAIYSANNADIPDLEQLFMHGRHSGWLEEQDELYAELEIERRNLARIIHEFLRIECGIKDIRDWSNAKRLVDLYDCKVCAKHVAQVVEAGIMPPKETNRFRLLDRVSNEEILSYIDNMKNYISENI